jgi:hypothetical protein
MKFHVEFPVKKSPQQVGHQQKLLLVGSCFTENIGEKLRRHKFSVMENPNGILFNPVSVAEAMDQYITQKRFTVSDLFLLNEGWHSWKHHSRFSAATAEESLSRINNATTAAHDFLRSADHLMITLGSAWTYTLTGEALNGIPGSVAANNHKAPAAWFARRLQGADEVTELLDGMLQRIWAFNPSVQVIFTISPVRHLREGVIENNRSKAVLIQAVHAVADKYEQAYYFPAYELVIDDLRDYRFYAEDLVHPNYQATQYVWEKFSEACMTGETRLLMRDIAEIDIAFRHKPFNETSAGHSKFLDSYCRKTKELSERYPFLDLSEELKYFGRENEGGRSSL